MRIECIIQNMSLVEEFVEQQLSKNISSTITSQLQICHSAVEDLLINLESLRSGPKLQIIRSKISRISIFLEAKQEILRLIQAEDNQTLIEWLIDEKLNSTLLVELVRSEQRFVEEVLRKTIKNIFLNGEKLEEYLQENQLVSNCLSLLVAINEDISVGKAPTRDKLISIDNVEGIIWEKVHAFESKITLFNREISKIIEQLYEFQNSISEQFRNFLNKNTHTKTSPSKNRFEALDRPDEIYEQNVMLQPLSKISFDRDYSRTQGEMKFGAEYRQEPFYHTGFPVRDNYTSKVRPRNDVSQLGISSQIVINPNAPRDKERNTRSELLAEPRPYLR